jgi:hypothetical protein
MWLKDIKHEWDHLHNQSNEPIMFTNIGLLMKLTWTVCLIIEPFVLMFCCGIKYRNKTDQN